MSPPSYPPYVEQAFRDWAELHPGWATVYEAVEAGEPEALNDWCALVGQAHDDWLDLDYADGFEDGAMGANNRDRLLDILRNRPATLKELLSHFDCTRKALSNTLAWLARGGEVVRGSLGGLKGYFAHHSITHELGDPRETALAGATMGQADRSTMGKEARLAIVKLLRERAASIDEVHQGLFPEKSRRIVLMTLAWMARANLIDRFAPGVYGWEPWRHEVREDEERPATRKCTKCGREYPATTEHFYTQRGTKLQAQCKGCFRDWRAAYKARQKLVNRRYRQRKRAAREGTPDI